MKLYFILTEAIYGLKSHRAWKFLDLKPFRATELFA
jgi:hypothetical protein